MTRITDTDDYPDDLTDSIETLTDYDIDRERIETIIDNIPPVIRDRVDHYDLEDDISEDDITDLSHAVATRLFEMAHDQATTSDRMTVEQHFDNLAQEYEDDARESARRGGVILICGTLAGEGNRTAMKIGNAAMRENYEQAR